MVPLGPMARFSRTNTSLSVNHQGQFPADTISFNLDPGYSLSDATVAIQEIGGAHAHPGRHPRELPGHGSVFKQSLPTEPLLLAAALLAVYIILGMLYESLIHPADDHIDASLRGRGSAARPADHRQRTDDRGPHRDHPAYRHRQEERDHDDRFRPRSGANRGLGPEEAIFRACIVRFRPIMMTTMAALFGALPLALEGGVGSELHKPLGISIVGGLILSQVLTLFTTPVVYVTLDRVSQRFKRRRTESTKRFGVRGFFLFLLSMLQSLRIRNLALLEEIQLDFEAGFTAVTGETGAGKSILLGALSLLAGERADKTVIRQGAPACEVEASLYFSSPGRIDAVLAELGLPASEEGVVILKRSLHRDKPPRITVNGSLSTLAALQRLGEHWVDFHGPGEPRRLLQPACQLELLDLYGRGEEALSRYREKYDGWRRLCAERDRLVGEARLPPEQVEFLRQQLAQLESLELTVEAIEALELEFQRMSRSQELIALTDALAAGLTGDEGLQGRIGPLLREARRLAGLDPSSAALSARLEAAAVELNDLGAEFSRLGLELQFDPEHAEKLTGRMNSWLEARRRHGGSLPAVVAARESLRLRLEAQGDLAGSLERIGREIEAAEGAARREAAKLGRLREKAAKELAEVAARDIGRLGFKQAEFMVRIVALSELTPSGDCACEFLFSPNVGEAPLPLNRIASSGELARVMLALKAVLADLDGVPLLVFDEVDANVGGEIGSVVGGEDGLDRPEPPGALRDPPSPSRGPGGQPPRGDQGPDKGQDRRHDRPDSGEPPRPGGGAGPHARRPKREERPRPRGGTAGQSQDRLIPPRPFKSGLRRAADVMIHGKSQTPCHSTLESIPERRA